MPRPNDVLPCGTDSAKRRHAAHGQQCTVCDTTNTSNPPAADEQQADTRQGHTDAAL